MDQTEIECVIELAAESKKDTVKKIELIMEFGTFSVVVNISKN